MNSGKSRNITTSNTFELLSGGRQGGGSPGEQGAGGVRETGEERAGSGISMMAESGREIQKGKLSFICYCSYNAYFSNKTSVLLGKTHKHNPQKFKVMNL